MKNFKSPTSSDNLNNNPNKSDINSFSFIENLDKIKSPKFNDLNINSEKLDYTSDFKKQFNKEIANLTEKERLELYYQINKHAELLAKKYGLSTLKIGGNA